MRCGGYGAGVVYNCHCSVLRNSTWVEVAPMKSCKWGSGAVVHQGSSQFVFAGGYNGTNYLDEVEAFDGTSIRSLASLPFPLFLPCLVAISDTELMSIGGFDGASVITSRTFIYNLGTDAWSDGPELNVASSDHSCAVVDFDDGDGPLVVVAGGYNGAYLKRVEYLFLDDLRSGWKLGPDLPLAAAGAAMVQFRNSVILIGGTGEVDGTKLYRLNAQDGPWIEMEQVLERPTSFRPFILIPDELTGCQ